MDAFHTCAYPNNVCVTLNSHRQHITCSCSTYPILDRCNHCVICRPNFCFAHSPSAQVCLDRSYHIVVVKVIFGYQLEMHYHHQLDWICTEDRKSKMDAIRFDPLLRLSVLNHIWILSGYETLTMTGVNGACVPCVPCVHGFLLASLTRIQSLGVCLQHSITLTRQAWLAMLVQCNCSHFPHYKGPELLISTLN